MIYYKIFCEPGKCERIDKDNRDPGSTFHRILTWSQPPQTLREGDALNVNFRGEVLEIKTPVFFWSSAIDARGLGRGWAFIENPELKGKELKLDNHVHQKGAVIQLTDKYHRFYKGAKGQTMVYEVRHMGFGWRFKYIYEWVEWRVDRIRSGSGHPSPSPIAVYPFCPTMGRFPIPVLCANAGFPFFAKTPSCTSRIYMLYFSGLGLLLNQWL